MSISKYIRVDFEIARKHVLDHGERIIQVALVPHPLRYEKVEINGETLYRDKFLDIHISPNDMAKNMAGVPIYHLDPLIENLNDYGEERASAISDEIQTGNYHPPVYTGSQHKELAGKKELAFISVDICGSTSKRLADSAGYDRALDIFFKELGTIVSQFQGQIAKFTGDGFIAYIDHPSTNSSCDNAADMALSLLHVFQNHVVPTLKKHNLPTFDIRLGADYGEAEVRKFRVPVTGFEQNDIISDALNRAVKLQELAKPNQLMLGRDIYERLHVRYLMRCDEVNTPLFNYQVYAVTR